MGNNFPDTCGGRRGGVGLWYPRTSSDGNGLPECPERGRSERWVLRLSLGDFISLDRILRVLLQFSLKVTTYTSSSQPKPWNGESKCV